MNIINLSISKMNYDNMDADGLQTRILTSRRISQVKARNEPGAEPVKREGLIHEILVCVVWSAIEIAATIIVTLVIMDILKDLELVHFFGLLTGASILVAINSAIIWLTFKYKSGESVRYIYSALVLRICIDIYFILEIFIEDMDIGFVFVIMILYAAFLIHRAYKQEKI